MEKEIVTKTILILEDNPMMLSGIAYLLQQIGEEHSIRFVPTTFPTVREAYAFLHAHTQEFDIVLLDKNDKIGESFHTLDLERLGVGKIISISSVPDSNEDAKKRGITKVAQKFYDEPDRFLNDLGIHIRALL